jgi:hypothetical protein
MYVGGGSASATTVAIPAHQAGDLILIFAGHSNTTLPSLPAGYTNVGNTNSAGSCRIGYKIATTGSETSGTWTNAQWLAVAVFRNVNQTNPIGVSSFQSANNTTISIAAQTASVGGGTYFAGAIDNRVSQTISFANLTPIVQLPGGSWSAASFRAGPVASLPQQNYVRSSDRWASGIVEILAAPL